MMKFSKEYWEDKWEKGNTNWDLGYPAPALVKYFDQILDKNLKILIPGAGNAYEAEYLWRNGFKNVFSNEIAKAPVMKFQERVNDFPQNQIITENFFQHKDQYDLIIEHTFFTAISPNMREQYARKIYELLKPQGKMLGLLFSVEFDYEGPPYGGTEDLYRNLFEPLFEIIILENARNSIKPRDERELFIVLRKR